MTKTFFALAWALTAVAPAFAAPTEVRVSYADLDLERPADLTRLDRRIAGAVTKVCGSYAEAPQQDWAPIKACRAATRANVPQQIAQARAARAANREVRVAAVK
jgi:UrcA family protein